MLSSNRDIWSYNLKDMGLSVQEVRELAKEFNVTYGSAQRWVSQSSSGTRIVPPIVDFETRLDFCKHNIRNNQYRLLAGIFAKGEITKGERFHGEVRTTSRACQSYALAVIKAWTIMTHQSTENYIGKTFTSISIDRVDDIKNPWRVIIKYNDPENGVSPDLRQFPTNDEYKGMEEFFPDLEIPNDAIFD